MIFDLDARFNKGLITNCQEAINKYCSKEIVDNDDDDSKDDNQDSGKCSNPVFQRFNLG